MEQEPRSIDTSPMTTPERLSRRAALRRAGAGGLVAAGLAFGATRHGSVAADHDDDATPGMIPRIQEAYVAAWSSRDAARVAALYTDDVEFEQVATVSSRKDWRNFARS